MTQPDSIAFDLTACMSKSKPEELLHSNIKQASEACSVEDYELLVGQFLPPVSSGSN